MTTTATDLTNTSVIVTKKVSEAETVLSRESGHGYTYWVGVGLALYTGLSAALANVVQMILIKEKSSITTNHHVIIGGEVRSCLTIQVLFMSQASGAC